MFTVTNYGKDGFDCNDQFLLDTIDIEENSSDIRFVNTDMKLPAVGETFQSLVLTNAHDATSAYHVYNAVFRLVCSNGMVRSEGGKQDVIKIRHSGRAIQQLREAHTNLLETAAETAKEVEDFSVIDLTPDERGIFARAALDLRWAPEESELEDGTIKLIETAPVKSSDLLYIRRSQDRAIANTIGENQHATAARTDTERNVPNLPRHEKP